MTTPNTSSRRCWAYESTKNTAIITAVDTTTYHFGHTQGDSDEQWKHPSKEMPTQEYHSYSTRMPVALTRIDPKYPEFTESYEPICAQFLARFLGNNATNGSETHDPLNTGDKYTITVRHEERGGTTEELYQAVGCTTVGINIHGRPDKAMWVDETFAYGSLEDKGDRSILTTAPTASGGLTSGKPYHGLPYFTWNTTQFYEAIYVDFAQRQRYYKGYSPSTGKKEVYVGIYEKATLLIKAIMHEAISYSIWDDFNDGTSRNAVLKFTKLDGSNYVQIDLGSCYVTKIEKTGNKDQGHYEANIYIECPDVSGSSNFLNEGANFSTHFKGAYS